MPLFIVACVLPSFLLTVLVTHWVRKKAPQWGLIDQPADRKVHQSPTPLGGGIAIVIGVVTPILLAIAFATGVERDWFPIPDTTIPLRELSGGVVYRCSRLFAVIVAGLVLAAMGLLDDLRNLPWKPRLAVQVLTAIALVACGVRATVFVPMPWIGFGISVLWILVLVNSINFLDNMDGLTSGIALIASVLFAIIMLFGTSEPRWLVAGVLLVLAGSLCGFLCFNRPPASIFMGDSGSYFIGVLLASMTILGTFYEQGGVGGRHVMLAPLFILAIPLYDFCSVLLIRLARGVSPFHPDKNHFSHRLVELGFSTRQAVLTVHLATLTTGLAALLLYRVELWADAILILLLTTCVLSIVALLETIGRRNAKDSR